jgi:Ca2+-binding EF-hand superfamily protein
MFKKQTIVLFILSIALLAGGIFAGSVLAQSEMASPKPQNKIALGQDEVKQLLLLMDTDKNGKISKQEFMNFMAAEFDRLDVDKSGELDVKELTKSQVRASRPPVGK